MNVTTQIKMATTTSACQNTDFLRLRQYEFTSNETIILIYSLYKADLNEKYACE